MKTDLAHNRSFRRKLSAVLLAGLIVFSLFAQAFHFIYHAGHYNHTNNTDVVTLVNYEQSANCTLCDQMLHQRYSFLPAGSNSMTVPPALVNPTNGFARKPFISRDVNSLTNKAPPQPPILIFG